MARFGRLGVWRQADFQPPGICMTTPAAAPTNDKTHAVDWMRKLDNHFSTALRTEP
jgi:hypothetical protein